MYPSAKITIEEEGQPSVTLTIDPAEPPVSLGDLLKWAKEKREGTGAALAGKRPFVDMTYEELKGAMRPSGVTFVPDPESDLEDVLDSYRLAGRLGGVQVVAIDEVVCWTGDICEDLSLPRVLPWGRRSFPAFYHITRGANALEDAAKWLREQLG